MRTCGTCGMSIEGRRANARYCSTSCRVIGNRKPKLPQVMTESDRWVAWKPFRRRNGWSKMPIQVDGSPASSTDPTTWTSFKALSGWDRRGWVLGDGIGCIDLDDCIHDGRLDDWAREIVAEHEHEAVWIEFSPSGKGVHIFMPMEKGRGRVIRDGRNIEVYPPESGRFICVTGWGLRA
ncbi:DNA primase [Trueperella pyogenes]|uniref:DNA primase n=1 Tax=Trueperella pyogenes TaxID=1661 RepID=UPI00312B9216